MASLIKTNLRCDCVDPFEIDIHSTKYYIFTLISLSMCWKCLNTTDVIRRLHSEPSWVDQNNGQSWPHRFSFQHEAFSIQFEEYSIEDRLVQSWKSDQKCHWESQFENLVSQEAQESANIYEHVFAFWLRIAVQEVSTFSLTSGAFVGVSGSGVSGPEKI